MRLPDALIAKDTVTYAVKSTATATSTDAADKIGTNSAGAAVEGLAIEELELLTEGSVAVIDEDGTIVLNGSNPTKDFNVYVSTEHGIEKLGPINFNNFKYSKTASTTGVKQVTIFGDDSNGDGVAIDMNVGGSVVEGEEVGFIVHRNKAESESISVRRDVKTVTRAGDTTATIVSRLIDKLNAQASDILEASDPGGSSTSGIKFEGKTVYDVFYVIPFGFIAGSLAEGAGMSQDTHGSIIDGIYYSTPSSHGSFSNDDIDAVHAVMPIGSGNHMLEALKAGDTNRGGNATYVKYSIPMFTGQITPEADVVYEQLIIEWSNPIKTRGIPSTAGDFEQTSILFVPEDDTNSLLTHLDGIFTI